jgi:signal transduction histidine kinase
MGLLMKIFQIIKKHLISRLEEENDQIIPYGILGVAGFSLFYILNGLVIPNTVKEELLFRIIAFFSCLALALKNYWPKIPALYQALFWNVVLIFNIPFFFTFMLINDPTSTLWSIHWVLALTLLILLVDFVSFIILSCIGCGIAILYCFSMGSFSEIPSTTEALVLSYISFTLYYIFILKRRRLLYNKRFNSLKMQAGAIAHEMRTPLFSMSSIGHELKEVLPTLTRSYEEKDPASNEKRSLNKRDIDSINQLPQEIEQITRQAFSFIDIMLMNLREDFKDAANETCTIKKCVEDALKQYPFFPKDRELLHIQLDEDFEFKGNSLLIKHIFFNLLKNSIYYVKAADKGNITIKAFIVDERHILSFKDTGPGIASEILPHIFDKFYSRTKYGTGIGLSFCKDVMNGLGGDITCTSQYGEYTEFILTFPPLEKA